MLYRRMDGLSSIIEITAERTKQEQRYYISDMLQSAGSFDDNIRRHWGIENSQHWTLDVAFEEDRSRKRAGNSVENFSILTRLALNLLKTDTTLKASIKRKRKMAGWDEVYLKRLLNAIKNLDAFALG